MIFVYVKHYLNSEGIRYFDEIWFPHVESIIQQQEGYLGIETTKQPDDPECVNITVKFADHETLDAWIAYPEHQEVIDDLDKYRTRPWHWFRTENKYAPKNIAEWNEVPL